MFPMRILPVLLSLAFPAFSAIDLSLHPGSTRDWVKHYGASGDSARYRLEFIDDTISDSSSKNVVDSSKRIRHEESTTIDWRVRITRPDSPAVVDTAVLRILHLTQYLLPDSLSTLMEEVRVQYFSYWLEPSEHFPLDIWHNDENELEPLQYTANSSGIMYTGAWELELLKGRCRIGIGDKSSDLYCSEMSWGYSHSSPTIATIDGYNIVAWLANGAYWRLASVDGVPLPAERGSLGHALRKGESWVYRDTNTLSFFSKPSKGFITLEFLETPRDSGGSLHLSLRETIHPDSGAPSCTTLSILLDTLRHFVKLGTDSGTPWSPPKSMEGRWTLGLMRHLVFPDLAKARYGESSSKSSGEWPREFDSDGYQIAFDLDIGANLIRESLSSSIIMGGQEFAHSWTLVTHSLDNIPLAAIAAPARTTRDFAWLRARITQDPSLEVVRIGLDGTRSVARGAAGSRLLDRRGVGIVQVRDGQKLVTLQVVRP